MYQFKHEETGEVISVDYGTMIDQDILGCIEIDGEVYRRVHKPEEVTDTMSVEIHNGETRWVSDALGFPMHQLADFEADRKAHGFNGIEFKPDPRVPEFCQVHFNSKSQWRSYVEHRGMHDRNRRNGGSMCFTESDFEKARKLILRETGGGC